MESTTVCNIGHDDKTFQHQGKGNVTEVGEQTLPYLEKALQSQDAAQLYQCWKVG